MKGNEQIILALDECTHGMKGDSPPQVKASLGITRSSLFPLSEPSEPLF